MMSIPQIIGIDVGTYSTKGTLVTAEGKVLCRASIAYAPDLPAPGFVEQDSAVWWNSVIHVIRQLLRSPEARADRVVGIGVSGLFPALIVAGSDGNPLRPALLYSDNRAASELDNFRSTLVHHATGDAVAPKLRWLLHHEPETLKPAAYFFSTHNYIVFRLTGCYCLDYKVADAFQGMLDPARLTWRSDVAAWAGIAVEKLPPLKQPHEIAGKLTSPVAEQLGLTAGIPVTVGSGDSLLTLLSAGAIRRGDALISFGTTGWMGSLPHPLEAFFHDPRLMAEGAPYRLDPYVLTLGAALQWYHAEFASFATSIAEAEGKSPYQVLDDLAAQIPAGCDGVTVIPAFGGSRSDSPAESIIMGLKLHHRSAHLYRAILESFGYLLRSALERLRAENITPSRLICTGGGAASAIWRQIVSDITRFPLAYHPQVDPCLGSAFLVAYTLHMVDAFDAIDAWLPPAEMTLSSEIFRDRYENGYQRFLAAQKLAGNWKAW